MPVPSMCSRREQDREARPRGDEEQRSWLRVGLFLVAISIPGTLNRFVHAGPPSEKDAILADWAARESAVKSFDITWTKEWIVPRGSIPHPPSFELDQPPPGAVIPPEDMTLHATARIAVDGSRIRYSIDGEQWSPGRNRRESSLETRVFDGDTNRELYEPRNKDRHLTGMIEGEFNGQKVHPAIRQDIDLLPVKLIYRPLDPFFKGIFDPAALTLTSRTGMLDGRKCAILEEVHFGPGLSRQHNIRHEIWVDRERRSLPLRWMSVSDGRLLTADMKISYRQAREGEPGDWIPSGWTFTLLGVGDKLTQSATATVTDCKLNPSLPAETFTLEFPNGTWVGDKTGGKMYVIRTDGTTRNVQPGESMYEHQKLIQPEPKSPLVLILAALAIASLAALAVVLWRRRAGAG